ncbi:MAG: helix-turn-helix domain-containing protein, partial [Promethearchaeota archaeon]
MIDKELVRVEQVLHASGYETFNVKIYGKRNKLCYDILVKHKTSHLIFLVKFFTNIDNINMDMVNDIKAMSLLLNSKPLLIGLKNRYQDLEDNTIYLREGLPFISLKTLENIMIKEEYPHILARRGGGVIFLDGKEMKHAREQKNLTRKEISEKLNITKRTVCAYENESMAPSVEMAEKIKELLEKDNIYRSINILNWRINFNLEEKTSEKEQELTNFETHLQEIIEDIGISSYWYKKGQAPVELALFSKTWYMT